MKKLVSSLLITIVVLTLGIPGFALTGTNADVYKINSTKISDENTIVSDVLTFDELVKEIADDTGNSFDQVRTNIVNNKFEEMNNSLDRSFVSKEEIEMSVMSSTFRTLTQQFTVTSIYKPSLKFYCETSESGSFWGIVEILNVGMDREYNGITKQYGGTIYTNLEDAGTIFWIVNGDFFNDGTTTVGGGVSIGIDEFATVNFEATYSTDHYGYCYEEDRYYTY